MKVLVINAGSSSLKYQLIEMDGECILAKGICERIGLAGNISHTGNGVTVERDSPFATHKDAFLAVVEELTEGKGKVIDTLDDIYAVGHRTLHGGEIYKEATLITEEVIETILGLSELGPLHNPPQAEAMRACREVFGDKIPMVAIFDTSFHQTMPPKSYIFPIPYEYYEKYSVRRYGFHGTSHRYISKRYLEIKGRENNPEGTKIIVCHLGNGSSLTAVKDGKVLDTTMGLTPLDGFIMGTRSGAIDPSVVTYITNKENITLNEMTDILNKRSGFLGVSGISSDMRDVCAAADEGNERAILTIEILIYQLKKLIGGYIAAMGGCDAVIFTGGIGENVERVRQGVMENMEALGIVISAELNIKASKKESVFSTPDSAVAAMVIPTNEEIMIALDTVELLENAKTGV
ncbi:MAG: acetate kinase [Oscillospiraceae bacterium]|nr:acetate kinase [Oscillospiraceae bacterium]